MTEKVQKFDAPGEWDDEPDLVEFEYLGFPCKIVRNPEGILLGYVGVKKGCPLFEKPQVEIDEALSMYGGCTYSGFKDEPETDQACFFKHKNIFWIGFDCWHFGDCMPEYMHLLKSRSKIYQSNYKNIQFVTDELKNLCEQLKEAA